MPSGPVPVILIARHFPPSNASGAQRPFRLARYLPEFGYRPLVVCGGEPPSTPVLPDVHFVPDAQTHARAGRRLHALVGALQRRFPYDEQWPWALHAALAAEALARTCSARAVISTFPPAGTHYAAAWLARRMGLPWLADFRDPLYGNPGRWRPSMDIYDAALERFVVEQADRIVVVSDAVADRMRQRYPFCRRRIELIWNGYDPADPICPLPIPPRPYKLIIHAGVLYRSRFPIAVMDSLLRLIDSGRLDPGTVRLRLLGEIADRHLFDALPSVPRLIELGVLDIGPKMLPRSQALEEVASADILLLLDVMGKSGSGYTVPAKVFEYLRIARPVLALTDSESPVGRILQGAGVPQAIVGPDDSAATVDGKLLHILSLPSTPAEPSEWYQTTFDGKRQAGRFAELLDEMRKDPRSGAVR